MSQKILHTLRNAAKNGLNVCISGAHGIGKTALIEQVFNEEFGEEHCAYFTGSTIDPHIDFIGCPRDITNEDGVTHLEMVRPKRFAEDKIHAIFMDEYDRAPKPAKNALMELIQRKSINGVKYKNLKVIWTAVNADEDIYDVNTLDPAQHDRFHVHINMENRPIESYFSKKYGKSNARCAIQWWEQLTDEQKATVSPRRLDYALEGVLKMDPPMRLENYLPEGCSPNNLQTMLTNDPAQDTFFSLDTDEQKEEFLKDEKNFAAMKAYITKEDELEKHLPLVPAEKAAMIMSNETLVPSPSRIIADIIANDDISNKYKCRFLENMIQIHDANLNASLVQRLDEKISNFSNSMGGILAEYQKKI